MTKGATEVDIPQLEPGSTARYPSNRVVGQVVALYERGGLVTQPDDEGAWIGVLSYFASAIDLVILPAEGLFGFVPGAPRLPELSSGLHFVDGRASSYATGSFVSLEQIAADAKIGEEYADLAPVVLPRVLSEYERTRSLGALVEARRLLGFLASTEPSFERSVELLKLVVELEGASQEAVAMIAILYRDDQRDPMLNTIRSRVLEQRRKRAMRAEAEGRMEDGAGDWWAVHHLDPSDQGGSQAMGADEA